MQQRERANRRNLRFRLRMTLSRNWPASWARTTPTSPIRPPAPPPEKQPQRHARSQFDELLADQRYAATGYAPTPGPAEPQAVKDPYGSQETYAAQDPYSGQAAYAADTGREPTEDWALRPAVSDDRRPPAAFEPVYRADEGEPLYEPQGQLPPHERSFEQQAAELPRKKGWLITGALMSVAVVGLAGAVLWRSPSAMKVASGTPPLIKADTSPAKVAPENPGGIEVPNQDRQIYARGTQDDVKGVKLTGGAEQPIDVNQVARKDVPSASSAGLDLDFPGGHAAGHDGFGRHRSRSRRGAPGQDRLRPPGRHHHRPRRRAGAGDGAGPRRLARADQRRDPRARRRHGDRSGAHAAAQACRPSCDDLAHGDCHHPREAGCCSCGKRHARRDHAEARSGQARPGGGPEHG